ncbi:MAG: transposase [Gammaproteobacteria bacterium]|nr:transposase [Gammaproteobacteria bacterium]
MKHSLIGLSQMIEGALSSELNRHPVKTLCLLVYAALKSKSACINKWACKVAGIKEQAYENARFVTWRFLKHSVFDVCDAYRAVTRWLLSKVPGEIIVCMDWTDVGVFKVLAISLTLPLIGRTMPLYVKAIRKDMTDNEMTHMEKELLRMFFEGLDRNTRPMVTVLADRGFAKVELMEHIGSYGANFVIRLSRTAYVWLDNRWVFLSQLLARDYEGSGYSDVLYTKENGYRINLVVRMAEPDKVNDPEDAHWILATNLNLDPNEICRRYSHRMKIEEMFKDLKSAGFNVADTLCKDEETMDKIILVLCLAYVFLIQWQAMHTLAIMLVMVTTDKRRRKNTDEHSVFQRAIRVFEVVTDRYGLTLEEINFAWTYLIIHTKHRKRILAAFQAG